MIRESISKQIDSLGITQEKAALSILVSPATMSNFLCGKAGIHTETLERLCEELGLELRPKAEE